MNNSQISKELKALILKLKSENHPNYLIEARRIINAKYGKGWRERNNITSGNIGAVNAYY